MAANECSTLDTSLWPSDLEVVKRTSQRSPDRLVYISYACVLVLTFLKDVFKGGILHSTQHNKATDHIGKKVVVVGACTSCRFFCITNMLSIPSLFETQHAAHDICVDYVEHGIGKEVYFDYRNSFNAKSFPRCNHVPKKFHPYFVDS